MKVMRIIAVAAILGASAAQSARSETASRYIQDGLLACWDGVENAGVDVHDPSATVWKDLSGRYAFTLTGATVYANRVYFPGSAYGILPSAATADTFTAARNGTLEVVYRSSNTSGTRFLLESSTGNASTSTLAFLTVGGTQVHGCTASSSSRANTYTFNSGSATNRVAIRYSSGRTASAVGNGSTLAKAGTDWWGTDASGTTIIGWRFSKAANQYFVGSIYCIRLYSRQLTDAEIATNQTVDIHRFINGDLTDPEELFVSATPEEFGTTSPTYGPSFGIEAGEERFVSCPPVWTNAVGDTAARCVGWKLFDLSGNEVSNGVGNAFTYVHPSPAAYRRLEWQWEVKYKITATAGDGGTVSPTEQWVLRGATATVTANPNPMRAFYKWTGDVPSGVSAYSQTISFPADQPRTLNAGFGGEFYLSKSGSDQNDGTSWETAFATVTNALAHAVANGSIINIATGTYSLPGVQALTNGVTLRGATGNPEDVILQRPSTSSKNFRLFTLNHRDCVLSGLVLQGGLFRGDDDKGVYASGGCVYIMSAGGTITNCILRSNKTQSHHAASINHGTGSAIYCYSDYGVVTHCVISNNSTTVYDNNYGGPVYMRKGRIDNCLITKHSDTSSNYGGMLVLNNSAVAENCTVVKNHASANSSIYTMAATARVRNCVIAANTTTSSRPENTVWGGTASCYTNCVSDAYAPNAQCHAGTDLVFADATTGNWRPTIASSAVDVGGYIANASTLDLDGNPRYVDAIDAGCYELQKNGLIVGFTPDIAAAFVPASVTFSAVVDGAGEGAVLEYRWDFDNDGTIDEVTSTPSVTHTYTAGGLYSVALTGADTTSDESASTTVLNVFKANPRTLYVVNGNAGAAEPYDTWATAANTIQKAVNFSAAGAEVVVSNGTYKLSSNVLVDKEIVLRGLTGNPADVVLDGQASVRCLQINAGRKALIHSLTLHRGKVNENYSYGGGAYVHTSGGTVSNCIVRGCHGGGKYGACGGLYGACDNALFTHCVITNNTASSGQTDGSYVTGLAVHLAAKSRLEHSLVANNRYTGGWGESTVQVANGVVRFCTIVGNKARDFGGVNLAGDTAKVEHCIIEGNTSYWTDTNACPNAVRFKVWGSQTSPSYTAAKIYTNDAGRATLTRSHQITNCVADAVLINDWCLQEPLSVTLPNYLAKGELSPGPSSKARNAVQPAAAGALPETDVFGHPRLFGSRYDLGAVESQRTSSLIIFVH